MRRCPRRDCAARLCSRRIAPARIRPHFYQNGDTVFFAWPNVRSMPVSKQKYDDCWRRYQWGRLASAFPLVVKMRLHFNEGGYYLRAIAHAPAIFISFPAPAAVLKERRLMIT